MRAPSRSRRGSLVFALFDTTMKLETPHLTSNYEILYCLNLLLLSDEKFSIFRGCQPAHKKGGKVSRNSFCYHYCLRISINFRAYNSEPCCVPFFTLSLEAQQKVLRHVTSSTFFNTAKLLHSTRHKHFLASDEHGRTSGDFFNYNCFGFHLRSN